MSTDDVAPWLLDVAQDLVRTVKAANFMGKATFEHGHDKVTVERDADKGVVVSFGKSEV